jgi:hypothetical protein
MAFSKGLEVQLIRLHSTGLFFFLGGGGTAALDVSKIPQNPVDSLVHKMVMSSLESDTVARACKQFRPRIEAVEAADGDFIE